MTPPVPQCRRISLVAYRADPCGASALSWHRAEEFAPPLGLTVSRECSQQPGCEHFFRLLHPMRALTPGPDLPVGYHLRQLTEVDLGAVEELVAASYVEERLPRAQQQRMRASRVFDASLWLGVFQGEELVAAGISEFDDVVPEGVLDWFQVHPAHQGLGLGRALVLETLHRLQGRVAFVTVSGRCDNATNPEALYRRCGFEGDVVWCVRSPRE